MDLFDFVPYEQAREEQWADCEFCNNQGEIEVEDEDDTVQSEIYIIKNGNKIYSNGVLLYRTEIVLTAAGFIVGFTIGVII